MEGCPSPATIGAFTESGEPEGEVQQHVAGCAACRELVAELRENAKFLTRFRAAGVVGVPPTVDVPGLAAESDPAARPDLIDGYRILGEIHRGGQGVVYRAVQVTTQRTVAIKMLLAGSSATGRDKERFEREARIAAGLNHPNIVTVYEGGYLPDGRYAFAMEYIEGEPLDRWSRSLDQARGRDGRREALRRRLKLMAKVCDAVLCAHQNAIVHRDLKPANILVDVAGEPHVLDFGIARDMGPEERTRLTHPGGFAGTLAYASPEQLSGDPSRVDTRTDIYSLGVILYEMVSGRMPYAVDGSMAQAIRNIEKAEPAPLLGRTADPDGPFVDGEVSTIILKALAKDPARRYRTAAGLGNDISRYLAGEAIEARRNSTWYVLRKAAARHRLALSSAVLLFLLLAAFGAAMAWQAHRVEVRGRQLAVALSNGNIERGRALVQVGNIPEAESLLWAELLDAPPGVDRWDPDEGRLPRSRAWWALWELYAANPCTATVRTSEPIGPAGIQLLLPVPGHDDWLLVAGNAGAMGLRTLPDLALGTKSTTPAVPEQEGGPPALCAGAFTSAGEIVTVTTDKMLHRWNATTLEPLGRPFSLTPLAPGTHPFVSLSADGTRLAIRDSSEIRLFEVSSGTLLETIPFTPNERARSLLLSPDGEWLAFAEREGITVRRIGTPGAANYTRMGANFYLRSMAFAKGDGVGAPRLFFTDGPSVLVLDPGRPGETQPFANLESVSHLDRIALSGEGRWLAVASDDRRISLWDPRAAPGVPALPYIAAHDVQVTALTFTPGDRELLSGHKDGVVQRWDISDLSSSDRRGAFTPIHGHRDSVFAVAIGGTPGALRGYSGAYDRTVRAWDLASGRETACSSPLAGPVESIALSPDGGTVAVAVDLGDEADVLLLDAATLSHQASIREAHKVRCADLAFSPDGASLATAGDDGVVRLWDVPTTRETAHRMVPNPRGDNPPISAVHTVRFSPDGRTLGWGGEVGVVNLANPALTAPPRALPGNIETVRCLRFSPDGRHVAGAGNDSTVWIWDTASGQIVHEMKGHVGATYAVAFSPDGRLLASGGSDGTLRLWDAVTGENLAILRDSAHTNGLAVFAVQFTPDGDHLFVGGNNGYLGVWDLRHYKRHLAGNLEYWVDRLKESGRPSPMADAARRWAEGHKHGGDDKR